MPYHTTPCHNLPLPWQLPLPSLLPYHRHTISAYTSYIHTYSYAQTHHPTPCASRGKRHMIVHMCIQMYVHMYITHTCAYVCVCFVRVYNSASSYQHRCSMTSNYATLALECMHVCVCMYVCMRVRACVHVID